MKNYNQGVKLFLLKNLMYISEELVSKCEKDSSVLEEEFIKALPELKQKECCKSFLKMLEWEYV